MKRKIVITGASSAIGQAIAERLIKQGDHAVLHVFRNGDSCFRFTEMTGLSCDVIKADFTNQPDLERFCSLIKDADILVNGAAVTKTDLICNLSTEDTDAMLAVNIKALIEVTRAVLPGMMMKKSGVIVNLSSIAGLRGNRGQSVYAGTKGFMESFTRSLAAEYGRKGIRINAVAPGPIDAGSLKDLLGYASGEVKEAIATGRLGTPKDVAAATAFLCSDDAAFINGRIIPVDGGFMRGL
jgi:3-oxoacyl-[acyl-carrier protein] reductase